MLRPEIRELLDMFEAMPLPDFPDMGAEEARQTFARLRAKPEKLPDLHNIETMSIPGLAGAIQVRIYRPTAQPNLPALVWFHGGGWVLGDLETGDLPSIVLSHRTQCVVISVDYRLAPESRFPAAFDDCLAGLDWVRSHADTLGIDPERIAVGGDSAGGNLAATVAIEAAARNWSLCHQVLVYPVINDDFTTGSYTENATGYFLTRRGMRWFWDQYTTAEQRTDPRVAPLRSDLAAHGSRLAPAWIFTAQYDPLRDEGRGYADALERAGVVVERAHADDMIHGVFGMTLEAGEEVRAAAAEALRRAYSAASRATG